MRPVVAAVALLAFVLAGCSNVQQDTLRAVYGPDYTTVSEVPSVQGDHLEARVGDGPWQDRVDLVVAAAAVAGPRMAAPAPQGGGGDVQALPVNASFEVRIKEATRLGGLTAHWFVTENRTLPGDVAQAAGVTPGDGTFHASVARAGPFAVTAILTGSAADTTPAARYAPLQGRLQATWVATGQVEPVRAQSTGVGPQPPSPQPREAMVDRYDVELWPGAHVTARTSFDGTFDPSKGADVDLGLYRPDGNGAACSATGGGQLPQVGSSPIPDPAQASESLEADAGEGGAWSLQVGAQADGCGAAGQTYFYYNNGPVPYRLEATIG
ncbi:MAG TPA: hypothetical protein VM286_09630 [Candidatus Thermoplasmatota archaeon]|nr:hypothetical protein [Candidatus Thermoplasmatota archaeon]